MVQRETRLWELLAKKICHEATAEELTELSVLLSIADNDHIAGILGILNNYWEQLRLLPDQAGMETRSAIFLDKISAELHRDNPFESFSIPRKVSRARFRWWKAAAVLFILIGAGILIVYQRANRTIEIVAAGGVHKDLVLPDGTRVWLNSGSKIAYSAGYLQHKRREISLTGEAYFDVKHTAQHPFVIHTFYGINIEDIGTKFNVKAYPADSSMETTLIQGAIEIYGEEAPAQKLLLRPKQKFIYYRKRPLQKNIVNNADEQSNNAISTGTIGEDRFAIANIVPVLNKEGDSLVSETAWMQNQLAFESEPFSLLADRMARWYNIHIDIRDTDVAAYRFTGVFEGESLTQALDELQLIRSFHYRKDKAGNVMITK